RAYAMSTVGRIANPADRGPRLVPGRIENPAYSISELCMAVHCDERVRASIRVAAASSEMVARVAASTLRSQLLSSGENAKLIARELLTRAPSPSSRKA